ncbi:LOW QUALITY PROTEIN: hypothetical protein PHMEG_00016646 [Phytophthora megakarya]|uniref:SWIM-type domain-containing protein n=1 Tax=Phytophthora megakarya TaxID=4795 RepID=A0A225VYH8_9STRA|nr:LOW QUALITY PROTEIN: hypothetical protein PHMEG_00016646 [Phytophthora megakarya]
MLLGLKTRVAPTPDDRYQQIVSEIDQLHSSSRSPKTVPTFLRAVESRISAHVLKNLKREWEQFVNLMEETTCEDVSLSTWILSCHHQSFECHDLDWKCICLFSTSNHLLCRHIMHLAHRGHGFNMLPAMTIRERWSTLAALNSMEALAAAGVCSVRFTGKFSTPTPFLKQVVYVRLRRRERANQVVLSSAEKYSFAKAITVEEGLRVGESREKADEVPSPEGGNDDDELYQGVTSTIDPADAMATAKLKEGFENQAIEDVTNGISNGDDIPSTQMAVSGPDERTAPPSEKEDEASTTHQMLLMSRNQSTKINRVRPVRLRQSKITSARLAVHKHLTGLTIKLDELITWARNTPNVKHVLTTMEKYPVQLTDAYLRSRVIECQ